MVYIIGMNTIRHFFAEAAPAGRPYFVLPVYDDGPALYRSIGTGLGLKRPRFELLHLTVQTQGIVGIVTAVVAGGCGTFATSPAGERRGLDSRNVGLRVNIRAAIRPIHPTPSERLGAPF
jgi:hypothetical protein